MARISNLDFYAILGVHPNAEDIVIRAAFKALAQRYHPDRFNGAQDEAHRRMADLTNAYETLADPARRRKYDRRRGLASRQARFYFKNPARDGQPFGALAARAAARKAQRYRMAVYVLMVIVVILSGFNLHQHSAQIKEFLAWNRSSSGTIAVSAPIAGGPTASAEAPAEAAPSSAPPTSTTENVRILPIGQPTRPIGSNAGELQAPAPSAPETAVVTPPPAPWEAMKAPAPRAPEPTVAAPPPAPAEAMKAPARPAATEPQRATVATTAAPAADPAPKDAKRPAPKPVIAKSVEPDRPAAPPRPAVAKAVEPDRPVATPSAPAEAEGCPAGVAALGLCNRNLTVQGH